MAHRPGQTTESRSTSYVEERPSSTDVTSFIPKSWQKSLALVVAGTTLIISRSTASVFHPYFWAESGTVFYADAWNHGLSAIFHSFAGYPVLFPRLAAAVAVLFPLTYGPLVFVVISLLVQMVPLIIIFSKRFDNITKSLGVRLMLAGIYVCLPNSYEVNLHLISGQWQLAVIAFCILVSAPPTKTRQTIFDIFFLALSGLTGPFAVVLFPVGVWLYWKRRNDIRYQIRLGVVTACAIVDGLTFLLTYSSRQTLTPHGSHLLAPLGANLNVFIHLVGGQIVAGALAGMNGYSHLLLFSWGNAAIILAGLFYIIFTAYVIVRGRMEVRLFQIYALLIFAASLIDPKDSTTKAQWPQMLAPGAGNRYFYLPLLAFLVSLTWLFGHALAEWQQRSGFGLRNFARWRYGIVIAIISVQFLILATIGIPLDWSYPPFVEPSLASSQSVIYQSNAGPVTVTIAPPGWKMVLNRR